MTYGVTGSACLNPQSSHAFFVRWGLDLPMSVGAIAMSLSTIIVAANAQLLRRLKLQRAAL
jgi:cation transport ATPase